MPGSVVVSSVVSVSSVGVEVSAASPEDSDSGFVSVIAPYGGYQGRCRPDITDPSAQPQPPNDMSEIIGTSGSRPNPLKPMTSLDIKNAVEEAVRPIIREEIKPILSRMDKLEGRMDKMHSTFKILLAQSGVDEDGGIAPLNLVNIEGQTPPYV